MKNKFQVGAPELFGFGVLGATIGAVLMTAIGLQGEIGMVLGAVAVPMTIVMPGYFTGRSMRRDMKQA